MRVRTKLRLRIVLIVGVIAAAIGATISILGNDGPRGIVTSMFVGALTGMAMTGMEILIHSRYAQSFRKLPFAVWLAARVVAYGIFIPVFDRVAFSISEGMLVPWRFDLSISIPLALFFNFIFMIRRHIGPSMFGNLMTGRYYRPRAEERLVAFFDLKGSTSLAERVGDLKFHSVLNDVFFDAGVAIVEGRGEIYRYVGDEIIASWRTHSAGAGQNCLRAIFGTGDILKRRADHYRRHHGVQPSLRTAVHAGPLVVGEMGDLKREIVLLGDTMNTAARIEDVSRKTGHDIVVSEPALALMQPLPAGIVAIPLGDASLRGKTEQLRLFALAREAPDAGSGAERISASAP